MVSPRRLAAALSSLSVLSMLVVVMSLPPVMKKRDRPLVGDSPARIRVPDGRDCLLGWRCCRGEWPVRHPGIKSGAASVQGRVRGKPPESSPGQAPSCIGHRSHPQPESRRRPVRRVWGWGKRDGSPQGRPGGGGNAPRAGRCLMERSAGCKQSQEGDAPGSRQGTEAPRLPHESSTVACATPAPGHSPVRAAGKPSPRAGAPAGCARETMLLEPPAASPGQPRPQASRRRRWEPGRQPCRRALAVDQRVPVPEPPPHQVRPLGVGPPSLMRLSLRRVHAGEDRQRPVHVPRLPEPPRLVDALGQRSVSPSPVPSAAAPRAAPP